MKKKVFFLLISMNVGGVEKSLLSFISTLSASQYDVHLGLLNFKGGFMDYVPERVTIHHIDCYNKYWSIINDPPRSVISRFAKQGHLVDAFIHTLLYIHYKLTDNRYWFYKYMMRHEPMLAETFDVAVAYAGPSQMIDYYVCKKVRAAKKYGWIHFDITKFGIDRGMTRQLYQAYDRIFIVSQTAKERFDEVFPTLRDKTEVRYNVVSKSQISEMASSGPTFADSYQGCRLLTVGRLSAEKGQDVAIRALKLLRDAGIEARWYFVGDGRLRSECEALARELGVSDSVVFLGTQTNPYAYMRHCDVYVQPSRHEGYCLTLAEARCFDRPIVATCFTGAEEQLGGRPHSRVCGMEAKDIAEAVGEVLRL